MRLSNRWATLTIILLATALVLPRTAVAQQAGKIIGVVGGATLSDLSDSYNAYNTTNKWGGNVGLFLGVRAKGTMFVSLEPAWTQMGADIGGTGGSIDYIEVPFTLGGMARSSNQKLHFGGYVGFAPAFKVGCSIDAAVGSCDKVNGTTWFLPLGLRFLSGSGKGTYVGVDVRYLIPLGSAFQGVTVYQRSWAFRLILAKGAL
jgi:hypothetical protein